MKYFKTIFISILLLFAFNLNAQSGSKNALGIRVGDNDGFGGEISYQRFLKNHHRLELDLGFRNSNDIEAFKLVGLHQWVYRLENRFNWYVGLGAGIGSYNTPVSDGSFALVAGNLGIEYNLNIPLLLSLDIRPELGFNDEFSDDLDLDIALGIRYQF